jgi:adenosine deaminase
MLTPELLRRLPKAELHVHLDGSLRPATMLDLARSARIALPASTPDALARHMLVDDARNLDDYLARFELTIALLQTPEAIERVAWEMCQDAAADGIRYLEVRYCPHLSCRAGLSLDDVLAAELRGLARGEADFGIVARAINCSLRHFDPALSAEIARHSVALLGRGVVGFDLAGPEASHPSAPHAVAFEIAARGGLRVTVHAGEASGAASIAEAVHACRAERIGHGTRLFENAALRDYIRDRRILLETNITSNVQTRAVPGASAHPVRRYFDEGLNVTLSTDNWLMSGVTLSSEYWLAHTELRFTREEIDRMILNGFEGAFLAWPEREAMVQSVRQELEDLR